jgi:hypothetical protein
MGPAPKRKNLTSVRNASVLVLAVLLLLSPVCGALCQAQVCDAGQSAVNEPACHQSFSAASDSSAGQISSFENCGLQDLPVALPVSFRSLTGDSPLISSAAHSASPLAVRAIGFLQERHFSLQPSSSDESRSLSGSFEGPSLVLRI